jgi:hypothetical protein
MTCIRPAHTVDHAISLLGIGMAARAAQRPGAPGGRSARKDALRFLLAGQMMWRPTL